MKKRILAYTKRIDDCLSGEILIDDWKKLMEEHLIQISFFQHERLIHLIVTVLFAIMAVAVMLVMLVSEIMTLGILFVLLLVLLIPYIKHYYLLENETQKMYKQYDEILKRIQGKGNTN